MVPAVWMCVHDVEPRGQDASGDGEPGVSALAERTRTGPSRRAEPEHGPRHWTKVHWPRRRPDPRVEGEVMAHGNVVDRPSGVVPTRRRRLGLLSLAPLVARCAFLFSGNGEHH